MGTCRTSLLLMPALLSSGPAFAQVGPSPDPDRTAEAMIARQRELLGMRQAEPRCAPRRSADEIVVCATDSSRYRVQSTAELDPLSPQALRDGLPRAPDVGAKYSGTTVMRGCFLPPCAPPTMYMIDLATIPEAPPGSDADKIAKGEMADR